MMKYDVARVYASRYENNPQIYGSEIQRGKKAVTGSFAYGMYDVTYKTTQAGLIEYTVTPNEARTETAATVLIIALAIVLAEETVRNVAGGLVAAAFAA